MVGGRDYAKSAQPRRRCNGQPGSVFKPFVYATAINTAYDPVSRLITAATTYMDEQRRSPSTIRILTRKLWRNLLTRSGYLRDALSIASMS